MLDYTGVWRYVYARSGLFSGFGGFFEHEVHVVVRYDPSAMQFVKSCQLQFGIVTESARACMYYSVRRYRRSSFSMLAVQF